MKFLLVFASLLLLSLTAQTEPVNDYAYLHKISRHLTGKKPSNQEYQALAEAIRNKSQKEFFASKMNEYMASQRYVEGMTFRLEELFQLATPAYSKSACDKITDKSSEHRDYGQYCNKTNSLNSLFEEILLKNLSWDKLLTAKQYSLSAPRYSQFPFSESIQDFPFYKLVNAQIPKLYSGIVERTIEEIYDYLEAQTPKTTPADPSPLLNISFAEGDPRIAGALTTPRFFTRYTNVAINKNRRRAAAVFRIFLCDNMVPAIVNGKDKRHTLLDLSFARDYQVTLKDIEKQLADGADRHGTEKDCFSCHYKLDPLGNSFQLSGNHLSDIPSRGALVYKDETDKLISIPGRGIGDVAKAITEQPKYQSCQVETLWKWFIGTDVTLTHARRSQLTEDFNKMDRRVNSFVAHLLEQPEFREPPTALNFISFSQVKPQLQRCDSCHSQLSGVPTFASYPIGGSTASHETWIKEIKDRLHRADDDPEKMPKDWKSWDERDIDLIKQWINDGAQNDEFKL